MFSLAKNLEEEVFHGKANDRDKFENAKKEEIEKWNHMGVFEEVDDLGQETISTRWVCTEKIKGDTVVLKARLVARGFEEDTTQIKTDSPTCSKDSLRIALAIAASKGWNVKTLDIKSAYLQGHEIERDIFIKPPKLANTSKLWKLRKNVYGLNDSGRQWYMRLTEEVIKSGCKQCKYDLAVFSCVGLDNNLSGLLLVHVDDITVLEIYPCTMGNSYA